MTTHRWRLFTATILAIGLVTSTTVIASAEEKPTPASSRQRAHSGTVTTRLGEIKFEGDYITAESADKLREELKFQAAVQTYLWSFPIANVMALRDGIETTTNNNEKHNNPPISVTTVRRDSSTKDVQ